MGNGIMLFLKILKFHEFDKFELTLFESVKPVLHVIPKLIQRYDTRFKKGNERGPIVFIENAYAVDLLVDTAGCFAAVIGMVQFPKPFFACSSMQDIFKLQKLFKK